MTDTIALTGIVATVPRALRTSAGLNITSFRLASSQRRFDRGKNAWVDTDTNWYTVTAFRGLAENAAASLAKGDRVVVTGRLRIRSWENDDRSGTTVEVDADAIGHDLHWCTSRSTRVVPAAGAVSADGAAPVEPEGTGAEAEPRGGDGHAAASPESPSSETVSEVADSAPDGGGASAQTSFDPPGVTPSAWGDEEARQPF